MKKKLLIAFMLLNAMANAQTWFQQTSGTDSSLFDVSFVNDDTGFVCGSGTVLKTTDGGINWTTLNTGFNAPFQCIRFLDASLGFAEAWNGVLIRTTDGGATWNNIGPSMPGNFFGGDWFMDANTGVIAVGNSGYSQSQILKTTDGGSTWDTVYSSGKWISYFYFSDAMHGFATGNAGNVFRTTDGGSTWDSLNVGGNYWMSGAYFFNPDTGYVGGGNCISYPNITTGSTWKTTDGGSTWQLESNNSSGAKLFFTDLITGYNIQADCTGAGPLLKTTNGGSTWNNEPTPQAGLRGIFFSSASNGYAVGDGGVIIKYGIPTSINNYFDNRIISVYPNPATDNINIMSSQNSQLEISTMQGQIIQQLSIQQGETSININGLAKGVYVIRLKNSERTEVTKFIKE